MTAALIARADDGGLGVQTLAIAEHLRFDRILVAQIDPPRGVYRPERFRHLATDIRIGAQSENRLSPEDMAWLCECESVFTVEGLYNPPRVEGDFLALARDAGTRVDVYANAELFPPRYREWNDAGLMRVTAPTGWEADRLGEHRIIPQPVDTERISAWKRTGEVRRFLHVSAPAMLDRNGTWLLMAAVKAYVGPTITLFVAGPEAPDEPTHVGNVHVHPVRDVTDYWERYSQAYDALILPRVYGGLSLVMQEALANGMPVVCLDRYPENTWGGTYRAPVESYAPYRMKGGSIPVAEANPERLADTITRLALGDPTELSAAALRHADSISWHTLGQVWTDNFVAPGSLLP